ncbi:hypothetical protein D9M71_669240 [compost metagenome]
MLEARPYPLRRVLGLVHDVQADQPDLLRAARLGDHRALVRVGVAGGVDQGVDGVEVLQVVVVAEYFPGRLDHDRADLLGLLRAAGEGDAVVGLAEERLLAFLAVETIVDDVVEHRLVNHDRVARVGAVLVHQRAGLEWLDEFVEHTGDLAHLL